MRLRRGLVLVGSVTTAFGLFLACSFPDVTFAPTGADSGANDATSKADATIEDAITRSPDSAVIKDAAICATKPPCDCDEDGYLAKDCDASTFDASGRRFDDCDDRDALRHPEAGFVAEEPEGHNGDWDCNDVVERQPKTGLECTGVGLTGCSGAGFINEPKCGTRDVFYACQGSGLAACQPVATSNDIPASCK